MIRYVITGGQTGADQAGWRAAKSYKIATSGFMPKGFKTEDGPRPDFQEMYDAIEMESEDYPSRTEANIKMADCVLWFGDHFSPGGKLTKRLAGYKGIPFRSISTGASLSLCETIARQVREWLIATDRRVMIAGNRESSQPGIGHKTEMVCLDIFRAYNALEKRR